MAHDARSIANFFLDLADEARRDLTPMSLLKILYFGHAWHLAKYKSPLTGQNFEAWKFGPVNRVVYDQIKCFGKNKIDSRLTKFDAGLNCYPIATYSLSYEEDIFLRNIFKYYSEFHPYKLSDITHEASTPWDTVWNMAENGAVAGMVIPNKLILEWFETTGGTLYRAGEQRGTT